MKLCLRSAALLVALPALACACGSRSAIEDSVAIDVDAGAPHLSPKDSGVLLPPPDAGIDAHLPPPPPPPPPDAGPVCPTSCDDGIACTVDTCDAKLVCEHRPDDALCPNGLKCDGVSGCAKIVYAITSNSTGSALYEVTLPAGTLRQISKKLPFAGDVALAPDGTLYLAGVTLDVIDRVTGADTKQISLPSIAWSLNALDAAPDGTLYGGVSADPAIVRIDPISATASNVTSLPNGYLTSGDFAFLGGHLFATIKKGHTVTSDTLAEIDVVSGSTRIIGDIGFACVWGLATFQQTLYGFTCTGQMITIDTFSGLGAQIASVGASFNGATSR